MPPGAGKIRFDQVADDLSKAFLESLSDLTNHAAADLQRYAERLSVCLVEAAVAPEEERAGLFERLEDLAVLLADIHRIRISGEGWKQFKKVVRLAFGLLISFIAAAV